MTQSPKQFLRKTSCFLYNALTCDCLHLRIVRLRRRWRLCHEADPPRCHISSMGSSQTRPLPWFANSAGDTLGSLLRARCRSFRAYVGGALKRLQQCVRIEGSVRRKKRNDTYLKIHFQ